MQIHLKKEEKKPTSRLMRLSLPHCLGKWSKTTSHRGPEGLHQPNAMQQPISSSLSESVLII